MKKKVLLCWNYERESWVHQFEKIFNDDEYCFLNFFSKSQEKENFSKAKVYYWEEFNNIDHLLKEINPRIVVFMGLEGPYNLLLNFVCKQRGITTYYLQHGIFHSYEAYKYEERSMRQIDLENKMAIIEQTESTAPGKISFLKNSFSFNRISIFTKIAAFLLFKKFSHSVQGSLKFIAGESTQADRYIVYTKYLSKIFIERDKVPDSKFIEIGNHEANEIINRILEMEGDKSTESNYYLFIDEAFTGSPKYSLRPMITIAQYNNFLETLADYAFSDTKKLKVKLHPFSYDVDHFVLHPNIEYIKHADTAKLIAACSGVFGFSSTLLLPAIFVKKACIFKLNNFSHIHAALNKINYCKVLDFYTFKPADIEFYDKTTLHEDTFIKYFLYKADNNYIERLKNILHTNLALR